MSRRPTSLGRRESDRDTRTEGTSRWVIEQGFEMGRPSLIQIEVDKVNAKVSAVRVGGTAVGVMEGTLLTAP